MDESTRIPLWGQSGEIRAYAVVDAADAPALNRWRWHLTANGYARRSTRVGGVAVKFLMHRQILGLGPDDVADHQNRDRLDNRRANLRTITVEANSQNRRPQGGSSRHRGVYWDASNEVWRAYVWHQKRCHNAGSFADEDRAAEAARALRRRLLPFAVD